jgi:hypothetical protein
MYVSEMSNCMTNANASALVRCKTAGTNPPKQTITLSKTNNYTELFEGFRFKQIRCFGGLADLSTNHSSHN